MTTNLSSIYHIPCPWRWNELGADYFVSCVVILGDTITLVDAGTIDSPERAIVPFLRDKGRKPNEIKDIILTHGHGDHFDGIPALLKVAKPIIHVHEDDKSKVEDLAKRNGFSTSIIESFNDKQILELSGKKLRVIHTPGHSEGSVCFLDEESLIGISGDSIQGYGKGRPLIFYNSAAYEASVESLLKEQINVLMVGHPFPPYEKPVLKDSEPKAFINESLEAIRVSRSRVMKAGQGMTKPFNIKEIAAIIPDLNESTIQCLLNELSEWGRLEALVENDRKKTQWIIRK